MMKPHKFRYSSSSVTNNKPISQEQLNDIINIDIQKNNFYEYLHQISQFNIDLFGSPLAVLMKPKLFQGDMYEFFYLHEAEKRFILLNFLYSFLKSKENQPYEIMLIQGPNKLSYEQISIYLHESAHKEKYNKPPLSYHNRPTNQWTQRILNVGVANKQQLKLVAMMLPFTLEANRKIKAIICADINMFDLDYRARMNQKTTKMLLDTKLVVLSFKKDYHPSKEPIYVETEGESSKTCISKITKLVSDSKDNFQVRYLAPAEAFRTATHRKQDVFRSVMVSAVIEDNTKLKVTVYSPYPFELHEENINKGVVEEGQNYFRRKA